MIALLYCAMDKLNLIVVATLETIVICLFCIHSVSIVVEKKNVLVDDTNGN